MMPEVSEAQCDVHLFQQHPSCDNGQVSDFYFVHLKMLYRGRSDLVPFLKQNYKHSRVHSWQKSFCDCFPVTKLFNQKIWEQVHLFLNMNVL